MSKQSKTTKEPLVSDQEQRKMPVGRKFQPGQSGNPSGRPAMPAELKEAFRAASIDACRVLISIMNDPHAKQPDRIKAATVVLDRAYGTPVQAIDLEASVQPVVFIGADDVAD